MQGKLVAFDRAVRVGNLAYLKKVMFVDILDACYDSGNYILDDNLYPFSPLVFLYYFTLLLLFL